MQGKESRDIPVEKDSEVDESLASLGNDSSLAPSLKSELAWTSVATA